MKIVTLLLVGFLAFLLPSAQGGDVSCVVCNGKGDSGVMPLKEPIKPWTTKDIAEWSDAEISLGKEGYEVVTNRESCKNYNLVTGKNSKMDVYCEGLAFFDDYKDVKDWMCVVHQNGDRGCAPKPPGHKLGCTSEAEGAGLCSCDDKGYCNDIYTGASTKTGLKCVSCKGVSGRSAESNPSALGDLTKGEFDSTDLPCPRDFGADVDPKYEVYCNHYANLFPNEKNILWVCQVTKEGKRGCMGGPPTAPLKVGCDDEKCFCNTELCNVSFKTEGEEEGVDKAKKKPISSKAPGTRGSVGVLLTLGLALVWRQLRSG